MATIPRVSCWDRLVRRRWSVAWAAGLCALALQGTALAVGLGRLTLHSALDEPLSAEIELTGASARELKTLKAALAPLAQFRKAGIPRPAALDLLRIEVDRKAKPPRLRIRSERSFKEPFLHFLIQLDWAGGRLVKEYTALLDPPLYVKGRPPPVTPPRPADAAAARPLPEAPVAPEPDVPMELFGPDDLSEGRSPVYDVGPAEAGPRLVGQAPAQIGPTRRGDTLWSLARKLKPLLKASEYQIMLSLLRENPAAFRGGNVNRLRVGKILKLPAPEKIRALPLAQARAQYRAQLESWQALRQRLAAAKLPKQPAQAGPAKGGGGGAAPAGEPVAGAKAAPAKGEKAGKKPAAKAGAAAKPAAEPKPAQAAATEKGEQEAGKKEGAADTAAGKDKGSSDLLRIVQATLDQPGEAAGAGSGGDAKTGGADAEKAALRGKIQTLEEAVLAGEAENKELRERLKMLEEQVAKAQRLIEMQDTGLALAQRQAAERRAAAPPKAQPSPPKPQAEAAGRPPARATPKPVPPRPPVRRARSAETGLLDSLMGQLQQAWVLWVAAGAGVVILVILGLWMYRRRRSIAEFEESILSGSALDSRTHTAPSDQVSSGTDTSFLSDFGVPGMGSMHADEVDPLAEAEVYLAYGRTEQAEEVLRDAAAKHPDRPEIKLKLLEIYEQRKDLKAFETLAEELYPAQGAAGDPTWAKVVEMGRRMNPDNPLFKGGAPAAAAAAAAAAGEGAAKAAAPEEELEPFPAPDEAVSPEEGLELDLDDFLGPEETAPAGGGAGAAAPETTAPGGGQPATGLEGTVRLGDTGDLAAELMGAAGTAGEAAGPAEAGESGTGAAPEETPAAPAPETTATLELETAAPADSGELDLGSTAEMEAGAEGSGASAGLDENAVSWEEPDLGAAPAAEAPDEGAALTMPAESLEAAPAAEAPEVPDVSEAAEAPAAGAETPAAATEKGNGGDRGDDLSQWDEAATKLDLAKAYIDMGDKDGARSILDEVLAEGNEAQKKQASELVAQLGA